MEKCISRFYWYFGDGKWDSSQANWTGFSHVYTKDGSFTPVLYLKSCHNCVESFSLVSGARNINYNFNISRLPSDKNICWEGNNVCFSQLPRPGAYYWLWTFNDPGATPPDKTNDKDWDACHSFSAPGKYGITLKIWEPNCIRDTTICIFTEIKGPQARIKMPPPPNFPLNTCMRGKPINIIDFAWIKSSCIFPVDVNGNKVTTITYVTMTKVTKFVSGNRKYYCSAAVISKDTVFQASLCPGYPPSIVKINYRLDPAAVKSESVYDSFTFSGPVTWDKSMAIPPNSGKQYFYNKTGFPCYDQTMNENEIYKYNCQGPNLVRYTNNTIKYRLRYDIDNDPTEFYSTNLNPPGTPSALREYDRCFNKSYPWASDSLQYFWDFGDPWAINCTSSIASPNVKCRYSKEIQPWHLFQKSGCFSTTLKVTDTITKCQSFDQVQIIMEPPLASWEQKVIDTLKKKDAWYTVVDTISKNPLKLNYRNIKTKWNRIDFNSYNLVDPALGKRGLMITGTPCAGSLYSQNLDMNETRPSCGRQSWWVLFDSAQECSSICKDTSYVDYDSDGTLEPFPTKVANCNWIDQSTWSMMGSKYIYNSGGCKTIGFIVKTGDCVDTFFYHNFKYIADLNAEFGILDPDSWDAIKGIYTSQLDYNTRQNVRLCAPFQPIFTVSNQQQEGITHWDWLINKTYGAPWTEPVFIRASCENIKDTVYELCRNDSCIIYPNINSSCYLDVSANTSLATLISQGFVITNVHYILKLNDTVLAQDIDGNGLVIPGKYSITSDVRNVYGCYNVNYAELFVGHYTDFTSDKQLIPKTAKGNEVIFKGYARYFQERMVPTDPDLNPTPFWEDPVGYRNGYTPKAPSVSEVIEWDLDGDGVFETKSHKGTDSVFFVYNKVGNYTVGMRTIDSNNCMQTLERKAYIKVMDLTADFGSIGNNSVCAPQTVKFTDKSVGINNWEYTYYPNGHKRDSTKVDSVVSWEWDFGDKTGSNSHSYMQNPQHTYLNNGSFDVKLIVKMVNGCIDTVIRKNYVNITGQYTHFRIVGDTAGCFPFYLTVKDSSRNVTKWDFVLGDGNHKIFTKRPADSIFWLLYNVPGSFDLYLVTADSLWNAALGKWVTCYNSFGETADPYDPHFRVVCSNPPSKPVIHVVHDTLLITGPALKYKWYRNFIEIPNSNNDSLIVHQKGTYMVRLYYPSGCSNYSDTLRALSIAGFGEMDLMIYPNPVTENLTISGNISGPENTALIQIFNSTGQLVFTKKTSQSTSIHESISMKQFPAGIYLVEIQSGTKKGRAMVMKQ